MKIKPEFLLLTLLYYPLFISCMDKELKPAWPQGDNPFYKNYDTPFQVPPFDQIKNEHFIPAFKAGMKWQKEYANQIIRKTSTPDFANTIEALEASNLLLDRVQSVFFNLVYTNLSPELSAINGIILPMLSKHHDDIYMNPHLFAKVKAVYDRRSSLPLNEEQKKLLLKSYKKFKRTGINLSRCKQTKVSEINERLAVLMIKFEQNLLIETDNFHLVIDKEEDLSGLPISIIATAKQTAIDYGMNDKWIFTLHDSSLHPFLKYADNRDLRKELYNAYINLCNNHNEFDNNDIISEITTLRMERAQLLHYENHATYVLEENMTKTPEKVYDFLFKLWDPALSAVKEDLKQMQTIMNKTIKHEKLKAWDWFYYAEKIRQEKYNLDAEVIRSYFKIENVRDGIFTLCNKLYGLNFTEIKNIPKYHPDIIVYEIKEGNKHIGLVYMDLYRRKSKQRNGAWVFAYRKTSQEADKRISPILSLTCNFEGPSKETPTLLNIDEVKIFFHQFGHTLHDLFSNTQYSSLSGTTVAPDFFEFPSQIMEDWALDPNLLVLYATHYQTGETIPKELLRKIEATSKFNQGFTTTEYLGASFLDMNFHTITEPLFENSSEKSTISKDKLAIRNFEKKQMKNIGLIDEIDPKFYGSYFQHIFSHTGRYRHSGQYYSYIWAEVLASDAFAAFKESNNIFNKKIAKSFRENILEPGGTINASIMFQNFRGREPDVKYLLHKRGLNKQSKGQSIRKLNKKKIS